MAADQAGQGQAAGLHRREGGGQKWVQRRHQGGDSRGEAAAGVGLDVRSRRIIGFALSEHHDAVLGLRGRWRWPPRSAAANRRRHPAH